MNTENLEQDVTQKGASRRAFLASAAGVGSAWVAVNWPGILAAQEHAAHAAAHGGKFEFFSHEQAMEVEAVAAQIIPTDDTPGAREAGCVYFIDRALTTFDKAHQNAYREGLPMLQTKTREMFPKAAKFSALTSDQQMRVLEAIEHTPFFQQVRVHTITGFFVEPQEGGNRNEVGWKLIGFEGKFHYSPPFGYYDRESERGTSGGGGNHGQI
ncbi:MAG TPA: gluconate 2-dehydrogenase subunit 3 family protein [Bryobacteraceae bacterium]|nr:gluconate 2-dehydrogenase subunit 3 family protein [Bryobacteraceae bacterium]